MQRNATRPDSFLRPVQTAALRLPLLSKSLGPRAKPSTESVKGPLVRLSEPAIDCVITIDAQNKILEFNIAAQRSLGYEQEDVIGKPLTETIIPRSLCDDHRGMAGFFGRANPLVHGRRIAAVAVREDGSQFPVELTVTRIRGQRPPIYTAYLRDITGRKTAQTALKELGKISCALFENRIRTPARPSAAKHIAHIGSWSRDLLTGRVTWSEEMEQIFGPSPASFESTYDAVVGSIHSRPRGAVRVAPSTAFKMLQPYDRFHRMMRPDGTQRVLHHHIAVESDSKGKPIRVYGTAQDVTEAKQAEEKIQEQASLLDLAWDAIMVRDMDDRVEFWNAGAKRIYGWTSDEMLGQRACEFLYEKDPESIHEIRAAVLKHGQWNGECHHSCKDGHTISVRSCWRLVRDEDGQPKAQLVINTDITERKKFEYQFLRTQRLESIGTLASGVAHDLNNILAPILITAPLLRGEMSHEDREKLLTIVESSAQRGVGIVKQVLTFARGANGDHVLLRPVCLVEEMAKIAEETFPKSITVRTRCPKKILRTLEADPIQLHQVLLNLCVNARDAMPRGGTLTLAAENFDVDDGYASITPGAKSGPHVLFRVSDTGMGISRQVIHKIFEPFFTTKDAEAGTGLGLSTVLGIVKSHGGFMDVHSQAGHTSFRIFLPANESADVSLRPGAAVVIPRSIEQIRSPLPT